MATAASVAFKRRRENRETAPPVDDWGTLLTYRQLDSGFDRGVSWRLYLQPDGKGCVRMRYRGGDVDGSFAVANEVCTEIVRRHGADNMSTGGTGACDCDAKADEPEDSAEPEATLAGDPEPAPP